MRGTRLALALLLLGGCAERGDGSAADVAASSPAGDAVLRDSSATPGGGPRECESDLTYFTEQLWGPLLATRCAPCHNPAGLAQGSRMVYEPGTGEATLRANYDVASSLATDTLGGTSVLLLRPTGRHPDGHPGGVVFAVGDADYARMEGFVARRSGAVACEDGDEPSLRCEDPWPGRRRLRLLTRFEYENTLRDLVGARLDPAPLAPRLAPEVVVGGFDNHAAALVASPLLFEQWLGVADEVARAWSGHLRELAGCGASDAGEACARRLASDFGARAFRRPLRDDEIASYLDLYRDAAATASEDEALGDVLVALLISPHLLYRSELGTPHPDDAALYELSSHEIASELSYLLLGSAPDDALRAAADDDALRDPDEIAAHARRLLADPRSHRAVMRFVNQWLGLDTLGTVPRDAKTYPSFTAAARQALADEASAFVADVLSGDDATLSGLLLAPPLQRVDALAAYYGDDSPERVGLLGLGAVLAVHSMPTSPSPIHRGKLVRERLLCQPLAPPPPGITASPPPLDPEHTNRERFAAHAAEEPCVSCHRLTDPIGFGFDHFDAIGRWRADDRGYPIDDSGQILDAPGVRQDFEGLADLAAALADAAAVDTCFVQQWQRYATGLDAAALPCDTAALEERFAASGGAVDDLLVALTQRPRFRFRAADGVDAAAWPDRSVSPEPSPGADAGATDVGRPFDVADAAVDDAAAPSDEATSDPGTADPETTTTRATVETTVTSDWGAGYCVHVDLANPLDHALRWAVTLSVDGTLTDHWNSVASAPSGDVTFTGAAWNAELPPAGTTTFGFCADR